MKVAVPQWNEHLRQQLADTDSSKLQKWVAKLSNVSLYAVLHLGFSLDRLLRELCNQQLPDRHDKVRLLPDRREIRKLVARRLGGAESRDGEAVDCENRSPRAASSRADTWGR